MALFFFFFCKLITHFKGYNLINIWTVMTGKTFQCRKKEIEKKKQKHDRTHTEYM